MGDVWKATLVLGAMIGFTTVYQIYTTAISAIPNQNRVSTSLLGLSTSLLILVGVLALLNKFTPEGMRQGVDRMTGLLVVIAAIQGAFAIAARVGRGDKLTTSLLGLATGIVAILGVMKLLAFIDPRVITDSLGNLTRIVLVIFSIELLMGLASRVGGGKLRSNILTTTGGILAMVGLIALLGAMTQETIDRGIVNLTKMSGLIVGIEVLTATVARIAGGAKVQKILGSVTFTLLSFTGVVAILGIMKQETIDKGVLTLTKMVGLIGTIELMTAVAARFSGDGKMFGTLIGSIMAILTLTAALALLTMVDQESLRDATTSLAIASVAILAVGVALKAMGSIQGLGSLKGLGVGLLGAASVLISTIGFFGALKLILPIVDSISWNSLGKFTVGIGVMTALMGAMTLLVPALATLGGVMIASGGTGFVALLAGLGTAILAIGTVVLAVIGLAELLNLMIKDGDALIRGLDLLVLVGAGIGRFVGGIRWGIAIGVLEGIGLGLSGFGKALGDFSPESLQGVKSLATAILIITGSSILEGLSRFVNFGKSSTEIFTEQIKDLINGLKKINPKDATAASNVLAILAPMAQNLTIFAEAANKIPASAGLFQAITGNTTLDEFGNQISGMVSAFLGKGTSGYELNVGNIGIANENLTAMLSFIPNLEEFIALTNKLPESGGFVQLILGNTTPEEFGNQISGMVSAFLGKGTSGYELNVGNIGIANENLTAMLSFIPNLEEFIALTNKLPESGGWAQFVKGIQH